MKITYFNYMYDLYGVSIGSTVKALELYRALGRKNHQIRMHWRQDDSNQTGQWRRQTRKLLKAGFSKFLQEPNQLTKNIFYFLKEKKIIKNDCPDLLISRLESYVYSPVWIANLFKIPHIVEADSPAAYEVRHFYKGYCRHPGLMERIELKVMQNADKAFCVSNRLRDYFISKGVDKKKIQVITNGADINRFNPNIVSERLIKKHQLNNKIVIGFVGSFHFWHGVDNLIQLINRIVEFDSRIVFLMVGSGGALKSSLDRYVKQHHLGDRVMLTGYVSHEDVPEYIAAMDIVVAPYPPIDFFYYSPVKIYEYMACGKPVISTKTGQIAEIIEHGETGILCEPGDIGDVIHHLQVLIRNRGKRIRIGKNAAAYIADNHTWNHKANQLSALCEELVQSRKRRLTI